MGRRPRRLRPLPRQVDPHREEVHRAGQGRERVALVDGSGFWVPDLCPRMHSVHTDQEVMETPIFFRSGEVILLLLNKNDTRYIDACSKRIMNQDQEDNDWHLHLYLLQLM